MGVRYSPAEIANLEELVGDVPLGSIVRRHNQWAKENGYPERTERALHQFLKTRGMTVEPTGEYVRTGTILQALGISQNVVEGWVRQGWIKPVSVRSKPTRSLPYRRKRGPARRSFRRSDLVRMARRHPEAFAGAPKQGLFALLEDFDLCDAIRAAYPKRRCCLNPRRPVMNVETRERYPSIRAAAAATGLHVTLIRASIEKGHQAKGTRWVDDPFALSSPGQCPTSSSTSATSSRSLTPATSGRTSGTASWRPTGSLSVATGRRSNVSASLAPSSTRCVAAA